MEEKMRLLPLIMLIIVSCSFEEEVKDASNQCETKVRKVFEEFEEKFGYICLTEQEVMDLMNENNSENKDAGEKEVAAKYLVLPYTQAKNKFYGIYDPVTNLCTYSKAH